MDERSRRVERLLAGPVILAALLTIPVIALEESEVDAPWSTLAAVLNWATWLVFAIEVVVMLAVVLNRMRWLREHPLEVLVTVLTPPILPPGLQSLRVLRLLRLLAFCAWRAWCIDSSHSKGSASLLLAPSSWHSVGLRLSRQRRMRRPSRSGTRSGGR